MPVLVEGALPVPSRSHCTHHPPLMPSTGWHCPGSGWANRWLSEGHGSLSQSIQPLMGTLGAPLPCPARQSGGHSQRQWFYVSLRKSLLFLGLFTGTGWPLASQLTMGRWMFWGVQMAQDYHRRVSVWVSLTFTPLSAHYSTRTMGVGETSSLDSFFWSRGSKEKGWLREQEGEDFSL